MGLVGKAYGMLFSSLGGQIAAGPWTRKLKKSVISSQVLRKDPFSGTADEGELSVLINQAYNILLNRNPEPAGYEFWLQRLREGMDRDQFLHHIITSEEFMQNKPGWYDQGRWERCANLGLEVIIPLKSGGQLIGPSWDDSVLAGIIAQEGEWEPHITDLLLKNLRPGDLFVDAGANLGYFSIIASGAVGEKGRVISFEPSPLNCSYCRRNIDLNRLNNVTLIEKGLWYKEITAKIDAHQRNLGGAHIANTGVDTECIPMDSLHIAPHLIKMDIEGAEPFALRGMQDTLRRYSPTLILEINRYCLRNFFGIDANSIWDLLSTLGYKLSTISQGELDEINSLQHLYELCPVDGLIDVLATH